MGSWWSDLNASLGKKTDILDKDAFEKPKKKLGEVINSFQKH